MVLINKTGVFDKENRLILYNFNRNVISCFLRKTIATESHLCYSKEEI